MEAIQDSTRANDVMAKIAFARRGVDATTLSDDMKSTGALEEHSVRISDARARQGQLSLADNGFTLLKHKSKVRSFYDEAVIREQCIPELEHIVMEATGAVAVVVYDAVLRGSEQHSKDAPNTRVYEYAFKAHIDGTPKGFLENSRRLKPEVVGKYEHCAFAEYNVWRPLAPVQQKPLAVCDASTIAPDDLVPSLFEAWEQLPPEKRPNPLPVSGHYFHLAHRKGQRWYYFPDMSPDELMLFRQWDADARRPPCTPHTAFEHPQTPANATPRLSFEARTVAFFDKAPAERRISFK
jgi:hypothetical protein